MVEVIFKENGVNDINDGLKEFDLQLSFRSIRDMARNSLKDGFAMSMQMLITKIAKTIRSGIEEPATEPKFYNDAIRYLCVMLLENEDLYNDLIDVNKNNNIIDFAINDSAMDIGESVRLYNLLLTELNNKLNIEELKNLIIE